MEPKRKKVYVSPSLKTIPAGEKNGPESEESCRCKEVSRKSLPQMLKLMLRDFGLVRKKQ